MESINIWGKNGLIVRHCGRLTYLGLLANMQNILEGPNLDRLKYVVTDYSAVSALDLEKFKSAEIGALIHKFLGSHRLLNRNIRWAVATKDSRIEQLVRIMADRIGDSFQLRLFSDPKEALSWAEGTA